MEWKEGGGEDGGKGGGEGTSYGHEREMKKYREGGREKGKGSAHSKGLEREEFCGKEGSMAGFEWKRSVAGRRGGGADYAAS